MSLFLKMGGFAMYVWPAYVLAALVLIGHLVLAYRKHKKILRRGKDASKA